MTNVVDMTEMKTPGRDRRVGNQKSKNKKLKKYLSILNIKIILQFITSS